MKKIRNIKREKEFDTQTLIQPDINLSSSATDGSTKNGYEKSELLSAENTGPVKETKIYEPRPLTPDDDIYDDILEHFTGSPTKPKYWFEEFGDYWSCSCGHINRGDRCKNCGLERELLRSLFILHKPASEPSKLNKQLKKAKDQVDKEEKRQQDADNRRRQREASGEDLKVIPIETDSGEAAETTDETPSAASPAGSEPSKKTADDGSPAEKEPPSPASTDTSDTSKPAQPLAVLPPDVRSDKPASAFKKIISNRKIIIAIIIVLLLVAAGGAAVYYYLAAPAIQYEEAQKLQANGEYEKAIEKYKALDGYMDSKNMIRKCYISLGDEYFENGQYEDAIKAYTKAYKMKKTAKMKSKIQSCHVAIGDELYNSNEFEKAIESYNTAQTFGESEDITSKINLAKFGYVKAYQSDRTAQVEKYMDELMDIKYPGIQQIYDSYYAWHVKIIANTAEDDYSNDVSKVSRNDTVYFHATLSGGEPSEKIELYYKITWPNGASQIYGLDSHWQSGSKITARFQYPMPLFGKEGTLTFQLYDRSTNELMGTDSVVLEK